MKRILLFVATNIAVLFVLSISASILLRVLGIQEIPGGLNLQALVIFAAVIGFGGSFISLAMSKWMAKRATGAVVIENVRRKAKEEKNKHIGFNVITGEYVDMLKAGIIDPVKVVRGALENAASIAAMILTTEALITDVPEKDKALAMPPGGGMGGDF